MRCTDVEGVDNIHRYDKINNHGHAVVRQKAIFLGIIILLVSSLNAQEKKEYALSEIIDLGITNSPILSAWQREIEARQAAFEAAKRFRNSELELQAGRARPHDGVTQRETGEIGLSQTIENPFARRFCLQISEKEREAAEHMHNYARLEMTAALMTQFYRVLYLQNNQVLAQDNLASIQEIHRLIEKRARLGEVKELEYKPLELEEDVLVAKTLRSYPMIKKKEKDIEAAESRLSWVKWQRLPDFKLSGFIDDELDGRDTIVTKAECPWRRP